MLMIVGKRRRFAAALSDEDCGKRQDEQSIGH
jgi:hypothetical protein